MDARSGGTQPRWRQHEREQRRWNYRNGFGFSEMGATLDVAVMPELDEGAREAGVRLGNLVFQQPERGEERIWA